MTSLLGQLRSRKLAQWVLGYLAAAWVLLQVLEFLRGQFGWPAPIVRAATVFAGVACLAIIVLAWYHGERGRQRVTAIEAVLLALVLLAASSAAAAVIRRDDTESAVASGGSAASDRSIAVLPFDNFSDIKENEYFSDGIIEDVLTNLAKVGSLRVVSRTSVMRYKGTDKTVPQIARELGVAHVLEGSVRRTGNQVRITAQLITADDRHLWADSYDRDVSDVLAVQAEIARAITDALSIQLTAADQSHVSAGKTENVGAYDLHLRGRELLRNAADSTDRKRAIIFFRRALELDPGFAQAEASLSEAMLNSKRDSAFAAAKRAIALAPDLADGYAALAGAYRLGGQFREALVEARKAVDRNPNNAQAIYEIGYMTGELGAADEALPWLKRYIALEPASVRGYFGLAISYRQMGDLLEARRWIRRAIDIAPDNIDGYYWFELENALVQGDRAGAEAWADSLARDGSSDTRVWSQWALGNIAPAEKLLSSDSTRRTVGYAPHWAYILQQRGKTAESQRFIRLTEERAHKRIAEGDQVQIPSRLLTYAYTLGGEREKALRSLRTWIDHGLRDPGELLVEPMLASLHKDPEFLRIVEGMKQHQAQMRERAKREGWW